MFLYSLWLIAQLLQLLTNNSLTAPTMCASVGVCYRKVKINNLLPVIVFQHFILLSFDQYNDLV